MIKTLQIINYMLSQGCAKVEIIEHIAEIVDNGYSDKFDLSENDIVSITRIFEDDMKFESALRTAELLM